jgi:oxygen-independent coproporphyrinogen-3 oxidase
LTVERDMLIRPEPNSPPDLDPVDPWIWPRAAYVHIPFCAHKCGYCDFASLAGSDHLADQYLDALELEMSRMGEPQAVDTVFVGGGTPTRLDARQLERMLAMVRRWFPLTPGGEWTVEANPGTLDETKVDVLARGGVNRVSLGAQSFQPALLKALERNHTPEEVPRALDLIRPRFPYWSFDLIFGVPGSNPSMWADDVETALALEPSHLSCYGLVFEKGTALWKQERAGLVSPVDEEFEREMYEHTIDRLAAEGLVMYEISNFARPGQESKHNLVYWTNDAYFGVGLGAARYLRGVRSSNTRDLPTYLKKLNEGREATGPTETLDAEARARETAVLMLRRTVIGLDRDDFFKRTGFAFDAIAGDALVKHRRGGLLEDDEIRVRFTREGLFLADTVLSDLV